MRKLRAVWGRVVPIGGHDLVRTAAALGRKSVSSTMSSLSFKEAGIDDLVLSDPT
jgi:hypothetical protein